MRVAMEEDRPNCARSKRDAGFSHRGRVAPFSAPDTPRAAKPSVLCAPLSEAIRKGGGGYAADLGGAASGRHQPAEIHEPSDRRLGLPHAELARA